MAVTNVKDVAPRLHFESTSERHDWLAAGHRQDQGIWLVSWKPSTSRPAIPYEEAVEEALCYGWIDSTYRSLDDERGVLGSRLVAKAACGPRPTRSASFGSRPRAG